MQKKNPYANADGTPKKGQGIEFWHWAMKKDKEYLNTLSSKDRKKELEVREHLFKKMNS